jgi:hypothetical protein
MLNASAILEYQFLNSNFPSLFFLPQTPSNKWNLCSCSLYKEASVDAKLTTYNSNSLFIIISYLTPQSRVFEEATSCSATEEKSVHLKESKGSIP